MSKLLNLVLVGGAGTCSDALVLIDCINAVSPKYQVKGILGDSVPVGTELYGFPVLGGLGTGAAMDDVHFVDCLGSPGSYRRRQAILEKAGLADKPFETLVHPAAVVATNASIGTGCLIFPCAVLLSNVHVGNHVTILSGAVLNHGVRVSDWSILASGVLLSGEVQVGKHCYLGVGCSVRERRQIGAGSLVGMGAAVTENVGEDSVVAGVPARKLRKAE